MQAQWPNISQSAVQGVFDGLSHLVKNGLDLPYGNTLDNLFLSEDGPAILDCAELVATDDALWSKLPDTLIIRDSKATKEHVRGVLKSELAACR